MEPAEKISVNDGSGVAEAPPGDLALERRLRRNLFIALGVMLAASLLWGSRSLSLGLLLGGILGLFNQRWLEGSVSGILAAVAGTGSGRVPPWTTSKLILRYFVVAIVFVGAYQTGWFHPIGLGAGLSAFVVGVMIEAAYQVFLVIRSNMP